MKMKAGMTAMVLVVALVSACSSSQPVDDEGPAEAAQEEEMSEEVEVAAHGHEGEAHQHGAHDHHAHRFDDPAAYAQRWNDPARDEWQKPEALIEAMEIEAGMTVADIGAGTGYFIPFLAEAVGREGTVYAADIEESMLEYIENTAQEEGWEQVETVQATMHHSALPFEGVDRIVTINTWHHIAERGAYAEHLYECLKEGGSVWVVDYRKDAPTGPPAQYRMKPEEIGAELEMGGFEVEVVELELPHQFVVVGHR